MDDAIHMAFKALRLRHNDFQIVDAKASSQPTPLSTIFSGKENLIILKLLTFSQMIARYWKSGGGSLAPFHGDFFLILRIEPRVSIRSASGPGKK